MVAFKNPVDVRFGITPIPGNITTLLPADAATFIVPDWIGYEITPYRSGATFMVRDEDYSWNKTTGTFTLLQAGDGFSYNELLHVQFQPLQVGSGDITETDIGGFQQYPHTLRYTHRNQVTLVTDSYERRGRLEQSGSTIQGINQQGNSIKAIFYMSLPAEIIEIGQSIEIYDGQVLRMADTVKNFVKGQLNARIWL